MTVYVVRCTEYYEDAHASFGRTDSVWCHEVEANQRRDYIHDHQRKGGVDTFAYVEPFEVQ